MRGQNFLTAYSLLLALGGGLTLVMSAPALLSARLEDLLMLAGISLAAPSILRPLPPNAGRYSPVAFSMSVTGILLFGAETATWLAFLAGAAAALTLGPRRFTRLTIATASYAISAYAGGKAFELVGGVPGDVLGHPAQAVLGIVVAALALAVLGAFASLFSPPEQNGRRSAATTLRRLPSYLAMGGFGLGLALVYLAVGPVGLLVFLVPSAIAGQSFWRYSVKAEEVRANNAALEQRLGELEAINQISSHFASMHTIDHTLQLAAVAATKLAGFQLAFVMLHEEGENRFVPGAVSGIDPQVFGRVSGQLCEELAPAAAGRDQPLVITPERYPLYMKELRSHGIEITSLTLLPIRHSGELVGVLGVGTTHPLTEDRMRFLGILSSQTALAMDNASLYHRMKQLAISDYMTGLHNHRFFQESVDVEVSRCTATGRNLALMMLDIDHFKDFNDRHGHLAGDALLRQVSARLKSALRRDDIVCRYGGDEFAVILPDTDAAKAIVVAERVRQAVGGAPFVWSDTSGARSEAHLTVSIGIALLDGDCSTKQELVTRADDALYRAKQAGRNALSVYHWPNQTAEPTLDGTQAVTLRGSGAWSKTPKS
jgi:diguanylate cyclase (GGDEF)-like protein